MFRTALCLSLVACTTAPQLAARSSQLAAPVSIRDHGAVCDGVTDDRAAIQAALDAGAGGLVTVPDATCIIGQGAGYFGVRVSAGTTLRGEPGAVLQQAPGIPASVRLLQIEATGVTIEHLTLDGDREAQSPSEHRHGVFASGALQLTIRDVTARNFTGDGIYIYFGTNGARLERIIAHGNQRNGITFGGGTTGGIVTGCTLTGNVAQQLDSEPGPGNTVDAVEVTGNTLDVGGVSNDYALTVSGSGSQSRSTGWRVHGNTIRGGVYVVWSTDVRISGNVIRDPTTKPTVRVWRSADRIEVVDNELTLLGASGAIVDITGTGTGNMPDHVTIARNRLSATGLAHGVLAWNARSVRVVDNVMAGPGTAALYYAGVFAKVTADEMRSLIVRRNEISGFGQHGVSTQAAGGAIRLVDVSDNVFDDAAALPAMTAALALYAGRDVRQSGNLLLGGCTSMTAATPTNGIHEPWGNGDRWVDP